MKASLVAYNCRGLLKTIKLKIIKMSMLEVAQNGM
jgi:hypothetical protein